MPALRFGRQGKRPLGFCAKVTVAFILGLSFIVIWSTFLSPSASVSSQRGSFNVISVPVTTYGKSPGGRSRDLEARRKSNAGGESAEKKRAGHRPGLPKKKEPATSKHEGVEKKESMGKKEDPSRNVTSRQHELPQKEPEVSKEGQDRPEEEEEGVLERDQDTEAAKQLEEDSDSNGAVEEESMDASLKGRGRKKQKLGPLFDSGAHYTWKLCGGRTGYNYVPCLDFEGARGKLQRHRHSERSCSRPSPMCLVPLPEGYRSPLSWPESKLKVLYRNVAHAKLSTFITSAAWLSQDGEFLTFPQNQSAIKGGARRYIDAIEEMVPDIEWGKNIRVVLDIGCTDASFATALVDKGVLTLSLGLNKDEADLAQIALERGLTAMIGFLATRRLPFPGGVFDSIHCSGCKIPWHLNGGKLLLEVNRILRPGGYFILSTENDSIEVEEVMSKLSASICWNILAHRMDEISEVGVKIYQKPSSNDIYELRRTKVPPLCKENENPDSAWFTHIKTCLNIIPGGAGERGTEWPEEWPKRLDTFPDWFSNWETLAADTERWKAIVNQSYLNGMGIDWANIQNIMDMKALYGGFAAALESVKVWVMNVVPVHAPNTLPVIFERGLLGSYHDWCEPFSTYPRSYDLLHADHLFSRLKNRCKQPVSIVVEMDRILRPGGWAIIRDKVEIVNPLEEILRSLHWEIRMTYAKEREGIICAQKTMWRPGN